MSSGYEKLAEFYDLFMGSEERDTRMFLELIKKYHPTAQTVLEIACGTGAVLENLTDQYEIVGLDNSEEMLAVARNKFPETAFHHMDMTQFELGRTFDVILCLFDSINHVEDFKQWSQVFRQVHTHLNGEGIFIFDINSIERLEYLATQPPVQTKKKGHQLVMAVEVKKEYFTFKLAVDGEPIAVNEWSYPTKVIEDELLRTFSEFVKKDVFFNDIDESMQTTGDIPARVVYVCSK